ncbi:MAG: peptide ABC transporter substrate-binding protein [Proteobacteria bacterium]|jgi:oligopeptide transport system substrate-binding protein|nr:peptide ABC transporter substrate-binding protein [Pseudomonadota bacterium]MDA1299571.1 peptide ABC transporter substrate-binding protein [Pseudomonadota bacterium]
MPTRPFALMPRWRLLLVLLWLPVTAWPAAVDFDSQRITVALTQEPPSLNTIRMTDAVSLFVIGHTEEGLLRYDRRGQLVGGVAERWEVTPQRMTFWLREDARWSDGSAVTAHDFVFAWQRVNDPTEAAPFAAIMYPIRNAEAVQKGDLPVTSLGVRVSEDGALLVELEHPCGYCLSLMSHATFFPVKQAFYEQVGDRFGAEASTLLANGPFVLTAWTHGARLVMQKNPLYWNASEITLTEIEVGYITEDNRTRLNLFVDDNIALVRLGAETVKDASARGLRLRTFASGGLSFLRFNVRDGHPLQHRQLRAAIASVFDSEVYVNKVVAIPGYRPANTFFPGWLRGVEGRFVNEYPVEPRPVDPERGRQLISHLKTELKTDTIAPLTLLTVTSPTGTKVAEYFQGLLKQTLGLEVRVDQQTFKQYLDKSRKGQFDIMFASWYPDFDDIMTYADLQASWNGNNRGGYVNPEYDRWVRVLQSSSNQRTRMDAAAELQSILIEDLPVLPTAETGSAYILHPRLKGVVRRVIGADPDYTYARVLPGP